MFLFCPKILVRNDSFKDAHVGVYILILAKNSPAAFKFLKSTEFLIKKEQNKSEETIFVRTSLTASRQFSRIKKLFY